MTYDPKSHKAADCRNDHPKNFIGRAGFNGFHREEYDIDEDEDEDYEDEE